MPTRYLLAYRFWFYAPLMHSEDMALHDMAFREYESMEVDITALINGGRDSTADSDEEDTQKCREILLNGDHAKAAMNFVENSLGFETMHRDIIATFGRYPHRNKILGRESSEAEEQYLCDGGQTFGSA
ncbi:hypothetical protein QBC46DRAFT_411829 [Diplogelasinospora grovesii]|uniref:Uncharacterized protein n=1 Tax=Diplogelasinospora grovesii TaxID=303347 RepID=A0AAN6N153_9PEZI|nr:hypothetical protein QBC46DRAFT_411829 [Diplogelasinospora grovesii]